MVDEGKDNLQHPIAPYG